MKDSTKKIKPSKPYPDFPLFPHATGRWAKKIRGKLFYFGKWEDWQGARDKYLREKDYLHNGRTPPLFQDGFTIRDLCNAFMTAKEHLMVTGEITARTFSEYYKTCKRLTTVFDKTRLTEDLRPVDFVGLRQHLATTLGHIALGNEIQRVRSILKFAFDDGLIDKPVRYGQIFKKPSQSVVRKNRQLNRQKHGDRMFHAYEILLILENATQPLKSMVLLGINAGLGQTDISTIPRSVIDLESGWVDYPRPKTGIERRFPLWRETIQSLQETLPYRPKAKEREDGHLAFITKYGHRWVKSNASGVNDDAIGKELGKLLKGLGIKRRGVSFYGLRHSFQTVAEDSGDQIAVKAIMGHLDDSMSSHYRERISDDRLMKVVETVRIWLFGKEK